MMGKDQRRKKPTIFRIFLVPLIAIMLVQSMITIGTLVVRRLTSMLEEYSSGMMTRLVENRKVILENEMNQRWGSVYEQEPFMNEILEQFLDDYGINAEELLDSDDMKGRIFYPGFRPGHKPCELHGSFAGEGKQAAVQRVEHSSGHVVDHPLPHGGPGRKKF